MRNGDDKMATKRIKVFIPEVRTIKYSEDYCDTRCTYFESNQTCSLLDGAITLNQDVDCEVSDVFFRCKECLEATK